MLLVSSLQSASLVLDARSPIAWPLLFGALIPLYAGALASWVWWMRGTAWPVLCAYPKAVRGGRCRNRVVGEWRRCHIHKRQRRRRSDGHVIRVGLRRWQTVTSREEIVTDHRISGRGFLLERASFSSLLYFRGFARPPRDVFRSLPARWQDLQNQLTFIKSSIWLDPQGASLSRRLLSVRSVTGTGVSSRVAVAVSATRMALVSALFGLLILALNAISENLDFVNHGSLVCFMISWAVLRRGILAGEANWCRRALLDTWRWAWPFFLFAVLGGALIS